MAGVVYNNATYFYRKDAQGNIIAIVNASGAVVVKYEYDAWGNHLTYYLDQIGITDVASVKDTEIPNINAAYKSYFELAKANPFRYRGYYYDTETELYYLQTRYYDPEIGRFISQDSIEYADPETVNGLNLYAYCGNNPVMGYDPTGTWDWNKFWAGAGLVFTAIAAIAISVSTFGAGTPLAITLVAGVTLAAGILTGINGVATIVEAGTNYNFVRDGIFQGNETAYNWYVGITEGIATIGTMVLGIYNMTGRAKAARYGRKFLGKGYSKVGKGRWVSADGMRQLRFDTSHHSYKGVRSSVHFNGQYFKVNFWENARAPFKRKELHIFYNFFNYFVDF